LGYSPQLVPLHPRWRGYDSTTIYYYEYYYYCYYYYYYYYYCCCCCCCCYCYDEECTSRLRI